MVHGNVILKQNESSFYMNMVDFCKSESLFRNWPRKGRTKTSCTRDLGGRDASGKKAGEKKMVDEGVRNAASKFLAISRDLTRNDHFIFRINGFEKSWATIRKSLLAKILDGILWILHESFLYTQSVRKIKEIAVNNI